MRKYWHGTGISDTVSGTHKGGKATAPEKAPIEVDGWTVACATPVQWAVGTHTFSDWRARHRGQVHYQHLLKHADAGVAGDGVAVSGQRQCGGAGHEGRRVGPARARRSSGCPSRCAHFSLSGELFD